MMQNYGDALKYQAAEADSAGLATNRYGIYMESVEAKANKLQDSLNTLWSNALGSNQIGAVYDIGNAFVKLISAIGGLPTIIGLVAAALSNFLIPWVILQLSLVGPAIETAIAGIANLFAAMTTGVTVAGGAVVVLDGELIAMNALMAGLPIILGAVVLAFGYFGGAAQRAEQNLVDLHNAIDTMTTSLKQSEQQAVSLSDLGKQFDDLKDKTNKTVQEQQDFIDVQNKIRELLPTVNGYYNDQGNFVVDLSVSQATLNKLKQEEIDIEKQQLALKVTENMQANLEAYKKQIQTMNDLNASLKSAQNFSGTMQGGLGDVRKTKSNAVEEQSLALKQFINQTKTDFTSLNKEQQDGWIVYLNTQGQAGQDLATQLKGIAQEVQKDSASIGSSAPQANYDLAKSLKDLDTQTTESTDLMKKQIEGKLQYSDIQKAIAQDPAYLQYITTENGQISVNIDGLRKYDIAKAEDALATAKQSGATAQEVAILESYLKSLQDGTFYTNALADAQKAQADAAKKAAQDALDAAQKAEEALQKQVDAAKALLDLTIKMIEQEKNDEKDHLQSQLDNYSALIDARIAALDALKAEEDYKRNLKKDTKKAGDIQSQIDILKLDNSPEAKAKILLLQQQLADQKDKIAQEERDHTVEQEKAALEKEKKDFEKYIKDKIKTIENYLKNTGQVTQDALKMLQTQGGALYEKLLEWNRKYGTGVDQDIVDAWAKGYDAVQNYQGLLAELSAAKDLVDQNKAILDNVVAAWEKATIALATYSDGLAKVDAQVQQLSLDLGSITPPNQDGKNNPTPTPRGVPLPPWKPFHAGLDAGPVGGLKTAENEQIIKALKGEVVVTNGQAGNFLHNVLPNMVTNAKNSGTSLKIDNLLTINGNVDKDVMPQLQKMLQTEVPKILNDALAGRGIRRQTQLVPQG